MAGGSGRAGQTDNAVLPRYPPVIDQFFAIYLRYRRRWPRIVTYIQRVSQRESGLDARGGLSAKGEHGSRVSAPTISPISGALRSSAIHRMVSRVL